MWASLWWQENKMVFSSHCVGPRDQTPLISLDGDRFYLLSHLTGPFFRVSVSLSALLTFPHVLFPIPVHRILTEILLSIWYNRLKTSAACEPGSGSWVVSSESCFSMTCDLKHLLQARMYLPGQSHLHFTCVSIWFYIAIIYIFISHTNTCRKKVNSKRCRSIQILHMLSWTYKPEVLFFFNLTFLLVFSQRWPNLMLSRIWIQIHHGTSFAADTQTTCFLCTSILHFPSSDTVFDVCQDCWVWAHRAGSSVWCQCPLWLWLLPSYSLLLFDWCHTCLHVWNIRKHSRTHAPRLPRASGSCCFLVASWPLPEVCSHHVPASLLFLSTWEDRESQLNALSALINYFVF